jgi:hypothetical protein
MHIRHFRRRTGRVQQGRRPPCASHEGRSNRVFCVERANASVRRLQEARSRGTTSRASRGGRTCRKSAGALARSALHQRTGRESAKPRGMSGQKRGVALSELGGASPIPQSAVRVEGGCWKFRVGTQRAGARPMSSAPARLPERRGNPASQRDAGTQRRLRSVLDCAVPCRTRHSQGGRCLEQLRRTAPATCSGGEIRTGE